MYLHYQKSNLLLHDEPEAIPTKKVPIEALEQPISEILRQNLDICVRDLLLQAKSVVFEDQGYNVDEVMVVGFHNDEPLFGYIRSIWHFKSEIYVLCNLIIIIRFNPHYNSYEVLFSEVLHLVNLKNLFDFHPLGVYKINNMLLLLCTIQVTVNLKHNFWHQFSFLHKMGVFVLEHTHVHLAECCLRAHQFVAANELVECIMSCFLLLLLLLLLLLFLNLTAERSWYTKYIRFSHRCFYCITFFKTSHRKVTGVSIV